MYLHLLGKVILTEDVTVLKVKKIRANSLVTHINIISHLFIFVTLHMPQQLFYQKQTTTVFKNSD